MADPKIAIEAVLAIEGGYTNDPNDPGGETKFGICKREYPELDISSLTKEQAYEIYIRDYWNKCRLSEFVNQKIANEVFEQAVNLGWKRASLILQEALYYMGKNIKVDGWVGPKTIEAVNSIPDREIPLLLKFLNGIQFCYYRSIVRRNPKLKKFIRGWVNKRISF